MVYNTQNYWVFGLFPSSGILENTFRKLDLFPSSGEEGGEDTYSAGPQWLRLALSKGPNLVGVFTTAFIEDGNRSSFRNVVFSRIPDDGKCPKPH
jgi:hypothetical protein